MVQEGVTMVLRPVAVRIMEQTAPMVRPRILIPAGAEIDLLLNKELHHELQDLQVVREDSDLEAALLASS